jgi:hypothetical protein
MRRSSPPVKTNRRMKLSSMPLILRAVMPTGRIPRSTRDNDHPKRIDEEVDLLGESQAKADSSLVSAKRSLLFILEGNPSRDRPCAHATIWQRVAEGPGHSADLQVKIVKSPLRAGRSLPKRPGHSYVGRRPIVDSISNGDCADDRGKAA